MTNIQSYDITVAGLPVRVMQLETLGWAACVYTRAEGRKGGYCFGETQADVIAKITQELEG